MGNRKNVENLSAVWMKRAKEDLKSSVVLLKNGCFADSTYHAQQAAEKAAKALLVMENAFVEEHKIAKWFKKVFEGKIEEKLLNELLKTLRDLEKHWVRPKYPFVSKDYIWDPLREYDEKIASDALKKAKFVVSQIEKLLKTKYGVKL